MKKVLLLAAICLVTFNVIAQNEKNVLKNADQMIANRQYLSAYQLLDNFDPNNDNIAVVLKKEHIVLNYFSQSIMHKIFSLSDLKEGESLNEIRQNFETGDIAKTHEQFRDRKMTCEEVIDYIAEHDAWRAQQDG